MMMRAFLVLGLVLLVACEKEYRTYDVKDECGPIQGQIYHSIPNNDSCRIRCRNHCVSLDHEFASSSFIDRGTRCHDCNCTCAIV